MFSRSVGILTQDSGIAASINGLCAASEGTDNPVIIPGSNLYLFSWFCLIGSLDVSLRWKAAQAMAFAHASQTAKPADGAEKEGNGNVDVDDDDDDEEM